MVKQNKNSWPDKKTKTIIHGLATGVPENFQYQKDFVTALMEKDDSIDVKNLRSLFGQSDI